VGGEVGFAVTASILFAAQDHALRVVMDPDVDSLVPIRIALAAPVHAGLEVPRGVEVAVLLSVLGDPRRAALGVEVDPHIGPAIAVSVLALLGFAARFVEDHDLGAPVAVQVGFAALGHAIRVLGNEFETAVEVAVGLLAHQAGVDVDLRHVEAPVRIGVEFFAFGPLLRVEEDPLIELAVAAGVALLFALLIALKEQQSVDATVARGVLLLADSLALAVVGGDVVAAVAPGVALFEDRQAGLVADAGVEHAVVVGVALGL